MKPSRIPRALNFSFGGKCQNSLIALAVAVLAFGSPASKVMAQGLYYPVSPAGSTNYTGTPVATDPDLSFWQAKLEAINGTLSLQVPLPAGKSTPTATQLADAAADATNSILAGTQPVGVDLQTFAVQVVAYRPADRTATVTAISQAIVNESGPLPAAKIDNLKLVMSSLAKSQPSLIDGIAHSIFTQAATDPGVAAGIPDLAQTAIVNAPDNMVIVNKVVTNGLSRISTSVLSASAKADLFIDPVNGFVKKVLDNAATTGNPLLIDNIVKGLTNGSFLTLVPPGVTATSLQLIVDAAVQALPPANTNNYTLGAIAAGALRSQGAAAADIGAAIGNSYTTSLVNGYINGTAALYAGYVAGKTDADAIAAGAAVRGAVSTATIVQLALTTGSSPSPKDVVRAVVGANPAAYYTTLSGAISAAGVPQGTATLADIADGAVKGVLLADVGNVTSTILQRVYVGAGAAGILASAGGVVNSSIAAADVVGKDGAFADIVNKAVTITRNVVGASDPVVRQAIIAMTAAGGDSFLAAAAALSGDIYKVRRTEIFNAAFTAVTGQYAISGGDVVAATAGFDTVKAVQDNLSNGKVYSSTLSRFNSSALNASATNSVLASLYGAILANPSGTSATLAAAIKQSAVSNTVLTDRARQAANGIVSVSGETLKLVGEIASHAKTNALSANNNDILDYVGAKIVADPSLAKDIATAWVVVDPNHAHWVSHAIGFNSPSAAPAAVSAIFTYTQITSPAPFAMPDPGNPVTPALTTKAYPGTKGVVIDQPAAAAAIVAGVTTGIIEANLGAVGEKNALVQTVSAAVLASIAQNGTNLLGAVNPFNGAGDTAKMFRQSDGGVGTIKSGIVRTVGAAGAITGYMAQVTQATDTTISATTAAVLTAASGGVARLYALEIAQAAAQALRWVSTATWTPAIADAAASAIASAMNTSVAGYGGYDLTKLKNAALFGISEAENGTIGAGALGLNATGLSNASLVVKAAGNAISAFYQHKSATGTPVTDIFNL